MLTQDQRTVNAENGHELSHRSSYSSRLMVVVCSATIRSGVHDRYRRLAPSPHVQRRDHLRPRQCEADPDLERQPDGRPKPACCFGLQQAARLRSTSLSAKVSRMRSRLRYSLRGARYL